MALTGRLFENLNPTDLIVIKIFLREGLLPERQFNSSIREWG
jgi:hypothetical protein